MQKRKMVKAKDFKSLKSMGESIKKDFEDIGETDLADELILIDNTRVKFVIHKDGFSYLTLLEDTENNSFKLKLHIPTIISTQNPIKESFFRVLCAVCKIFSRNAKTLFDRFEEAFDLLYNHDVDYLIDISTPEIKVTDWYNRNDFLIIKFQKK